MTMIPSWEQTSPHSSPMNFYKKAYILIIFQCQNYIKDFEMYLPLPLKFSHDLLSASPVQKQLAGKFLLLLHAALLAAWGLPLWNKG